MVSGDDFRSASLEAMAVKGEPVIVREVESFTEWALIRTGKTGLPGSVFSDRTHIGDEESARVWARQYAVDDGMAALASRRVMQTRWEAV